jgi:hypothetical protein
MGRTLRRLHSYIHPARSPSPGSRSYSPYFGSKLLDYVEILAPWYVVPQYPFFMSVPHGLTEIVLSGGKHHDACHFKH